MFKLKGYAKRNSIVYFLFTFPALMAYTVFLAFPTFLGLYYSLTDWNGLGRTMKFIGIGNYLKILGDDTIMYDAKFTFLYTILSVILINGIALILALLITNNLPQKHRTFFRATIFFPAVLSLITVGLTWQEIFYRALPQIGKTLGIGFLSNNILSGSHTAMYGILFVTIWQGVSIPFVMIIAGLQAIPSDIFESATIDGANGFQKFFKITLRFLLPVLNVTVVLTVKNGLTVFDYIRALTEGGPGGATESIGLFIYTQGIVSLKYGYAIAVSMVLLVIICAISFVQLKVTSKYEVGQL